MDFFGNLKYPDRNGNVFSDEAVKSLAERMTELMRGSDMQFVIPIKAPPSTFSVTGRAVHNRPNIDVNNRSSYKSYNRVIQEPLAGGSFDVEFSESPSITEFMRSWQEAISKSVGIPDSMLLGKTTTSTEVEADVRRYRDFIDATMFNRHHFNGLTVQVITSWVWEWRHVYFVQPPIPPRGKRKGTRKQWKRAHPQGWRRRYVPVEPDHVIRTFDTLYCTEKQFEVIKQHFADAPKRGPAVDLGYALDDFPFMERKHDD